MLKLHNYKISLSYGKFNQLNLLQLWGRFAFCSYQKSVHTDFHGSLSSQICTETETYQWVAPQSANTLLSLAWPHRNQTLVTSAAKYTHYPGYHNTTAANYTKSTGASLHCSKGASIYLGTNSYLQQKRHYNTANSKNMEVGDGLPICTGCWMYKFIFSVNILTYKTETGRGKNFL